MSVVCPAVLATNSHDFREQMEKIEPFAERVQIDLMDGDFAQPKALDLMHVWWPENLTADLHLMYREPGKELESVLSLAPNLVIVHAEAEGIKDFITKLRVVNIKCGLALLAETPAEAVKDYLDLIDHVLIFSGDLGSFGGSADFKLLDKVKAIKDMNSSIEIGWDGGVNDQTAEQLIKGGIDVLNVGGFIQNSSDPAAAYAKLKQITNRN